MTINGGSKDSVDKAIAEIISEQSQAKVSGIHADFSKEAEIDSLIKEIGKVEIRVNNVGIFGPKEFLKISDADWKRFYGINVLSGDRLSRAFLAAMEEQDWGRLYSY